MGLDNSGVIDAIGIENATGMVIMTIADAWDWSDPHAHLMALQAKLNVYFGFVETGELLEATLMLPDGRWRSMWSPSSPWIQRGPSF